MKLFGRSSPEEEFWSWFAKNASVIRTSLATTSSQEDFYRGIFQELSRRLSTYHPGLVWEFGQDRKTGTTELVISADGNRANFGAVEKLTSLAPLIPTWKITAFRPRKSIEGLELQFAPASASTDRVTLSPKDIRFQLQRQGDGRVALRLFVTGMREGDEQLKGAMFLLLDAALGEYDVETKVGLVEVYPAAAAPPNTPLEPLPKLPDVVDRLFGSK